MAGKLNLGGKKLNVTVNNQPQNDDDNTGSAENTPINIEVTIPQEPINKPATRKVGTDRVGTKEMVTFLAMSKNFTLFRDGNDYIIFRNYIFETNNPIDIEFIRNSSSFDKTVFEGEYPPQALKELDERSKYFTKDPDEYEA